MIDDDIQEEPATPGRKLRSARESRELGINDVAVRLHLDSRFVTALEEDDYDALPNPIYVRGYIRNYSKLLGIGADELLALYEAEGRGEEPEIIPEIKYPTQTSSSDKPVKAFTYFLTLGLVILLIAWWQSSFIVDLQTLPNLPAKPVAKVEKPGLTRVKVDAVPLPVIPLENLQEIPVEPIDDSDVTNTRDVPGGRVPAAVESMDAMAASPPVAADRAASPAEEKKKKITADPGAIMRGNLPAGPDSGADMTGLDSLVLNLNADSWIEIIDATDRKIYFDLARSGDVLNLHGLAPFDVTLGFAQGVTIEYNGDTVDHAPTRAGVARFTLGE